MKGYEKQLRCPRDKTKKEQEEQPEITFRPQKQRKILGDFCNSCVRERAPKSIWTMKNQSRRLDLLRRTYSLARKPQQRPVVAELWAQINTTELPKKQRSRHTHVCDKDVTTSRARTWLPMHWTPVRSVPSNIPQELSTHLCLHHHERSAKGCGFQNHTRIYRSPGLFPINFRHRWGNSPMAYLPAKLESNLAFDLEMRYRRKIHT